jgi:S1-C subfamily serine protease
VADGMSGTGRAPVGNPPPRRRGFLAWTLVTALLAVACGALAWHLAGRTPDRTERLVPAPPSQPSPEQVARAAQLTRLQASLEEQLAAQLAKLDTAPVCRPDQRLDQDLLQGLRGQEAPNLETWRGLLLASAPAAASPERAPTVPAATPAPAPPPTPSPAGAPAKAQSLDELRALLEGSSAMVLGPTADGGLSTGTAFFVAPDLLVTNRHVVAEADAARLMVTSKRLGGLLPVELVAASPPGDQGAPDFALLRLRTGTAPAVVPIAAASDKLAPVIAAGYPGLGLRDDAGFRRLLAGDLAAAPDLNMNRGEVRSIQTLGGITRLVHTADVLKGYSGGPLLDTCGRIVGVNTFIQVDQAQGGKLNNAVSSPDLMTFLQGQGIRLALDARGCAAG